jgi:nucleotide-binding universal stress UspA family protein
MFGIAKTASLLQEAPFPVLTVNAPPTSPYKKIILALKDSPSSRRAIGGARKLGLLERAEVSIVHAFSAGEATAILSDMPADQIVGRAASAAAKAGARLFRLSKEREIALPRASIDVREGAPHIVVARSALALAADLVVIGAPPSSMMRRFLTGSTALDIIGKVHCDVLAVPSLPSRTKPSQERGESHLEPLISASRENAAAKSYRGPPALLPP